MEPETLSNFAPVPAEEMLLRPKSVIRPKNAIIIASLNSTMRGEGTVTSQHNPSSSNFV